ncbi:MAG: hypothetical protein GF381_00435 [Candidatus Pacebacteria bacterium]|nr:hypothetical protein [Candidatus Paceibacterota bacterium]
MTISQLNNLFQFFRALVNDWLSFWLIRTETINHQLAALFEQNYAQPVDQLLISMIFGRTKAFSQELRLKFNLIGMLHVVCASGFNVSLVAGLLQKLLQSWFPRRILAWVLIAGVWFYWLIAAGGLALTRAALMISFKLVCRYIWMRQYRPLASLFFSACLIVLLSFDNLNSISFQLTVAATVGMLIFSRVENRYGQEAEERELLFELSADQPIRNWLKRVKKLIIQSFISTVFAQLAVLPLILYYFGELSWVSFLSNSLILWLVPIMTILGLIWSFLGLGLQFVPGGQIATQILAWPLFWLAELFIFLTTQLSYLGSPWQVAEFNLAMVVAWYVVLIFLYKLYKFSLKYRKLALLRRFLK